MRIKITQEDLKLISQTVAKTEELTSGEIVPVILESSDFYAAAHYRCAFILTGIISMVAITAEYFFNYPIILHYFINIQAIALLTGYFMAYIPFIKRSLILKKEMDEEVHQRAIEIFHENGIAMTKNRAGILLVISYLERRVEVLADCGINQKVGNNYWNDLVLQLIKNIKANKLIPGMIQAIESCGEQLKEFFPHQQNDQNELPDDLIT